MSKKIYTTPYILLELYICSDEYCNFNNPSAYIRIDTSHIIIEYENVYDCIASIITGHGISSATPTSQEVVENENCTFTANILQGWQFDGWYENADFSGNPISTSSTYTTAITKNTTLYPKAKRICTVQVFGTDNGTNYTVSFKDNKSSGVEGEEITITITPKSSSYTFGGFYESNSSGNQLETYVSSDNPYTITLGESDVYLYASVTLTITVTLVGINCLISPAGPILSAWNKHLTFNATYDTDHYNFDGWFDNETYTNKIGENPTLENYQTPNQDITLYAKASLKLSIYAKIDNTWTILSEAYVKVNNKWEKVEDLSTLDLSTGYDYNVEIIQ